MTDAETFFVLLAIFYLFECLSFAPSGAQAFVSKGLVAKRWRQRLPAFRLSGAHKEVFCAPILPWPGMIAVKPAKPSLPPPSPRALRHLRKEAAAFSRATSPLRSLSLIIFLHYFLILPILYHLFLGTIWALLAIAVGELLAFYAACRFYRIHKRYFPKDKWERRLETFYTAFFPWHTMRASDLLLKKQSRNWHPLVLLASDPDHSANDRELKKLWRQAHYHSQAEEIESVLDQAKIDHTNWDQAPEKEEGQKFCPLCHTIFDHDTTICSDCGKVELEE